jgi:hypothetical protein
MVSVVEWFTERFTRGRFTRPVYTAGEALGLSVA